MSLNHKFVLNEIFETLETSNFDDLENFINKIKHQLSQYDYIFFFNINMKVLEPIGDEIIPNKENDYLMGCEHPLHYKWLPFNLP